MKKRKRKPHGIEIVGLIILVGAFFIIWDATGCFVLSVVESLFFMVAYCIAIF